MPHYPVSQRSRPQRSDYGLAPMQELPASLQLASRAPLRRAARRAAAALRAPDVPFESCVTRREVSVALPRTTRTQKPPDADPLLISMLSQAACSAAHRASLQAQTSRAAPEECSDRPHSEPGHLQPSIACAAVRRALSKGTNKKTLVPLRKRPSEARKDGRSLAAHDEQASEKGAKEDERRRGRGRPRRRRRG